MPGWLFQKKEIVFKNGGFFCQGVARIIFSKDASKFLNQIIKKQRMGFSRAGLGMEDPKEKQTRRVGKEQSHNILSGEDNVGNMSYSEIGSLIRQKL